MLRFKRGYIAFVAISMLLIITLTACNKGGSISNNGKSKDGQVTLKWVIGGSSELMDSKMVWDKFNEELQKELPNTKVEFEAIPFSDFAERWKLMAASREPVDIAWVAYTLSYDREVRNGSYMALNELIDKNAPDLKKEIPDWAFAKQTIDGKIYSVPCMQMMSSMGQSLIVDKELAEKYNLDVAEVERIFTRDALRSKEDFAIIQAWLERLKNAGELRKGIAKSFTQASVIYSVARPSNENIIANANVMLGKNYDPYKVYDMLEDMPQIYEAYDVLADWYKKGYIRKDILSVKNPNEDVGKKDGYVAWGGTYFKNQSELSSKQYKMPVIAIPVGANNSHINRYIPFRANETATAISATSTNPERAIKLIELMNTAKGKELYNLLVYGLEGTHYTKVNDNRINWLGEGTPGASSNKKYGFYKWSLGNTFNAYETQFDNEGWNDYIRNEINAKATPSPILGFKLNLDPIQTEVAQYDAIMGEYKDLDTGALPNYKELLKERNDKLKKAGSDKIVEEVQKQLNEWVEKYKK